MFDLTMPLCVFTLLFLPVLFAAGFPPVLLLISTIKSTVSCVRSVMEYLFSVVVLFLGLLTSFILVILFCQFMQTLLGRIPTGHFILRHLEKRIKAQLKALRLEERKAACLILQHLEEIDQWDGANAQLLVEIRAAEAIIGKKGWDWEAAPKRNPRSKTVGSTFFVHGPFSRRPLEAPEPSAWSIVRWWRGEEDPRVWAAKKNLTHQQGVLSDKRAVLARLEQEKEDLEAKRDAAFKKRDAVQWGSCQPKPTRDRWAEIQLGIMNRSFTSYKPAPHQQQQTNFFRRAVDLTDERVHFCEFCTISGHRWRCQYESFAAADVAPFTRPCPSATARLRTRPSFVSAVPFGTPSFFDQDLPAVPHGPPAPAPVCAAPSIAPPAPQFPATSATLVPAKATASIFTTLPAQASVPKASAPTMACPPSAPQSNLATSSPAPSAVPVTMSTAATADAPITKTAPAAPKGKGPPSALQIVWPGQTAAPAAAPAAPSPAPVVKTASAAPKGNAPPSALQIVWPAQPPAGASSSSGPTASGSLMSRSSFAPAVAPSTPVQGQAKLSHEQMADALVKEEAKARALEKKAAAMERKKELSTPQVNKKDYRFG